MSPQLFAMLLYQSLLKLMLLKLGLFLLLSLEAQRLFAGKRPIIRPLK